jgi:RNA polymerase sigma-70 factor, ECF subfamily
MTVATASDAPGPDQLISALVRQHHSVLLAHAVRLTGGDHAWAEDVVQETFIRAWRRIDRMTTEHGSVRSWLMRVAHNVVVDGHRVPHPRPANASEIETNLQAADDASDHVLSALLVCDALAMLADGHREVLEQIYLQDKTMTQAARDLRLPVGTVKSRVFYALRNLRAQRVLHSPTLSSP